MMELELSFNRIISYVQYQNKMDVLFTAKAMNDDDGKNKVVFRIQSTPRFFDDIECRVDSIPPNGSIDLMDLPDFSLRLDPEYISSITEATPSKIKFTAEDEEGEVLGCVFADVEVQPFDFWSGVAMAETIASFVTPNAESLAKIRSVASDTLGEWGDSSSLEGYQSKDFRRVLDLGAAFYAALQKENINYVNPPARFENIGQRIRIPDEVLSHHEGTCIDLAVTFAAAIESIGLNPVIFITNGHAFAGFWLEDNFGPDITTFDNSVFTRRIRNKEMRAVECTCFTNSSNVSFDDACNKALLELEDADKFVCGVDIKKARSTIRPIPVKKKMDGQWVVEREEADNSAVPPKPIGEVYKTADDRPLTRVDKWKRDLLDITNKNNLINMKQGTKVIPLLVKEVSKFEDKLAAGTEYTVYSKPQEWEGTAQFNDRPFESENYIGDYEAAFEEELKKNRLRTPLTDVEMEKNLRSIYRLASKELEESGCNSLFIALGVLRWYEGKCTGEPHYAPLILLPVEIKKKQKTFAIKKLDEETVFNVTLAEKLKQEYEIEIPNMDPLPLDASGVNVDMILQIVRHSIAGMEGWEVLQGASIGVFSFSQYAMWKDLDTNIDEFENNQVVKCLVDGVPFPDTGELDVSADPYDLCLTVPADGSQIKAVRASGEGKTFVMHGPPGTGKSQTITNMICNALYHDKTVLFVAEKRAALEVVQKRLEEVGVINHCLELHSNKTEKTKVIEQLRNSLTKCPEMDDDKIDKLMSDINGVRKKLDVYVSELHKPREFGISAYDAISRFEAHNVDGSVDIRIDYRPGQSKLISSVLPDVDESIRNACLAYSSVSNADLETLEHVRTNSIIASMTMDVEDLIEELKGKSEKYISELDSIRKYDLPIDTAVKSIRDQYFSDMLAIDKSILDDPDITDLEKELKEVYNSVSDVISILRTCEGRVFQITADEANDALRKIGVAQNNIDQAIRNNRIQSNGPIIDMIRDSGSLFNTIVRNSADMSAVAKQWKLTVYHFNSSYNVAEQYATALRAGFLSKSKSRRAFFDKVTPHLVNPIVNFEDLADTAAIIGRLSDELLLVENIPTKYTHNNDLVMAMDDIRNRTDLAHTAISIANKYHIPINDLRRCHTSTVSAKPNLVPLEEAEKIWIEAYNRFAKFLDLDVDLSKCSDCMEFCTRLESQLPFIFDWTNWNHYKDEVIAYGAPSVIPEIKKGIHAELIIHSFRKSVYKAYINVCRQESEVLRMFSSTTFEDSIKKFKQLDQQYMILYRNLLKYKLAKRVPNNIDDPVIGSETYILNKAVNSSKIRKSIRTLLSEIPNMLPRICPCFLMSPQSVSQYITMAYPKFDLVIFDESSQITTCKAIGSLGRAENAIIAGDSKQLPPTTFFLKKIESEDDEDMMDVDSFLDDCLSLKMPETYLEWHYRSRHESLISFSNRMFYDGKMLTFPSPNDLETKVSMNYVEGVYEKGKRCNPIEAKAVVDEIYRRVMDDELVNQSIGVIAFGISQQTCIQDMLDDRIKKDSKLFQRLNTMPDEIFIKNLETVQGDERDVILFSIGYGPDSSGHVLQNFGPINRDGGQRRLNVAVSRARMEMVVFTSMRYTDVIITSTSSKGVRSLREFLKFAENHGHFQDISSKSVASDGTEILVDIANTLKDNGYDSRFNVGTSLFKVDIGIIDPDNPSEYILGLLSDGDSYKASENTRDREYARADVLRRLGWNLMNVWSVDWYFNRNRTLEKILQRLKELRKEDEVVDEEDQAIDPNIGFKEPSADLEPSPPSKNKMSESTLLPYEPLEIEVMEGFDPEVAISSYPFIEMFSRSIVFDESPICESYLVKLYCKHLDLQSLPETKREQLITILRDIYKPDIDGEFVTYWSDPNNRVYINYRVSEDPRYNRSIDCVPFIEIVNAVEDTVRINGSIASDKINTAVARSLGYARTGSRINEILSKAVQKAISDGRIKEQNDRFVINDE